MERAEFLTRVETHKMEILLDTPDYKHLRFQKPDTTDQYFTLMFYPGYCVFAGDMGEWVFSRVPDMMAFFRGDKISPVYWAEKCKATSRFGRGDSSDDFYNFDMDAFKARVWEYLDEWKEAEGVTEEEDEDLIDAIRAQVIDDAAEYYNEFNAMRLLNEFSYEVRPDLTFNFTDAWEWRFQEFTGYFLFCCHAIQWGIDQYDRHKADNPRQNHDFYYNKDDWETTYDDIGLLKDECAEYCGDDLMEVGTLNSGPSIWLARVASDVDEEGEVLETEVREYKSPEAAQKAQKDAYKALCAKYPQLESVKPE